MIWRVVRKKVVKRWPRWSSFKSPTRTQYRKHPCIPQGDHWWQTCANREHKRPAQPSLQRIWWHVWASGSTRYMYRGNLVGFKANWRWLYGAHILLGVATSWLQRGQHTDTKIQCDSRVLWQGEVADPGDSHRGELQDLQGMRDVWLGQVLHSLEQLCMHALTLTYGFIYSSYIRDVVPLSRQVCILKGKTNNFYKDSKVERRPCGQG